MVKSKLKSKPKSRPLPIAGLKRAIEERNAPTLAGFYAEDAVARIIDRDNPPSTPRSLEGKSAIRPISGCLRTQHDSHGPKRCRYGQLARLYAKLCVPRWNQSALLDDARTQRRKNCTTIVRLRCARANRIAQRPKRVNRHRLRCRGYVRSSCHRRHETRRSEPR